MKKIIAITAVAFFLLVGIGSVGTYTRALVEGKAELLITDHDKALIGVEVMDGDKSFQLEPGKETQILKITNRMNTEINCSLRMDGKSDGINLKPLSNFSIGSNSSKTIQLSATEKCSPREYTLNITLIATWKGGNATIESDGIKVTIINSDTAAPTGTKTPERKEEATPKSFTGDSSDETIKTDKNNGDVFEPEDSDDNNSNPEDSSNDSLEVESDE